MEMPLDLPETRVNRSVQLRRTISAIAAAIAVAILACTSLLISPPRGESYPGVIPWRENSWLKALTDGMSLNGLLETPRGVEIKDFAYYLGASVIAALFAVRAVVSGLLPPDRMTARGAWFLAQALLGAWVAVSALSAIWSPDGSMALGQTAQYAFGVSLSVALAWCVDAPHLARVLWGYAIVAGATGALCVWYYFERNPAHRPGFPIGNPSTLAAFMLPALFITGFGAVQTLIALRQRGTVLLSLRLLAIVLLFAATVACFVLADSRGARLGLVAGGAGLAFLLIRESYRRWMIVALLVGAAATIAFFASSNQDVAMARGATIRFRFYAWRYAAELWSRRPISGCGAGAYPQLSGPLSFSDRALDPAAFMGEGVEHAHNELFEVFAEIGLVGGLTFVAGFLATLVAASGLLQSNLSPERRWLMLGLVGGTISLMADALFGVGLRLPGVPPLFYILVGVLWAACRSVSRRRENAEHAPTRPHNPQLVRRLIVSAMAMLVAIVGAWQALRNWQGVQWEQRARREFDSRAFAGSVAAAEAAQPLLLDPVRRLVASEQRVRSLYELAAEETRRFHALRAAAGSGATSAPDVVAARVVAVEAGRAAWSAAIQHDVRAPSFGRPLVYAGRAAQLLATLAAEVDAQQAVNWLLQSAQAWRAHRLQRPYDAEALLAIMRLGSMGFYIQPGDYLGLLRDALRAGSPGPEWHAALDSVAQLPEYRDKLRDMFDAVLPYGPNADVDTLILTCAPEMHRLRGWWNARNGQFEAAAGDAARAAELYQPLRSRFPYLPAVALGEQAENEFRRAPEDPRRAIEQVRRAMASIPEIQAQKRDELLRPHRRNLARYQLAAGDAEAALLTLRAFPLTDEAAQRLRVELAAELCRQIPALCAKLGISVTPASLPDASGPSSRSADGPE